MTRADQPRRESILGLARRMVGGLVQLARLEMTRGRQEIGEMLGDAKKAALLIGVALALLLLALIALVALIILGLAALTGLPGWLMALMVFVVLLVLAAFLGYRGVRKIRIGPPQETMEAVKEDMAWAKRLLKRE